VKETYFIRDLGIYSIYNFLCYIGNPLYDSLDEATWKAEACKRLPNLKKLDGEPVIREVQE
jgi:dynein light chain 1